MSQRGIVLLVVTGLLATGFWLFSRGEAQQPGPVVGGSAVAVVNIVQVFKDSQEMRHVTEQSQKAAKQLQAEVLERQKKLKDMERALEGWQVDSKEYREGQQALLHETINARTWMEESEAAMVRDHQRRIEQFYQKMADVVRAVAREEGFDLVLSKEDVQVRNARNPDELLDMIRQRRVLYESLRADVTAKVIARLDAEFANPPR